MDRKHGKRPLPLEEEEKAFPIYSSRSQQDISAVVSALVQVIGGNPEHKDPTTASQSSVVGNDSNEQSQPPQHQGMPFLPLPHIFIYTFYASFFLYIN